MPDPAQNAISRRKFLVSSAFAALPRLGHARSVLEAPTIRRLPILTYHRFADTASDSMTIRTSLFEAHLRLIKSLKCNVVVLQDWVDFRRGKLSSLPDRAIALSADDGHRSQYEVMAPVLAAYGWPMTLFIYPSAISNARYAMIWAQVQELVQSQRFALGSHTYWHPHLPRARREMPPTEYQRFAWRQLGQSKAVLEQCSGQPVSLLAWPFGRSDANLHEMAEQTGYQAAFALGNRTASADDPLYDVPRYLMVDGTSERNLELVLLSAFGAVKS